MPNHFAHNLKILRKRAGKTQRQAADEMIINRSRLGAWEEGRSTPGYDQLIGVANYFKVTIDQIIREEL